MAELVIGILLVLLIFTNLGLTAYIAWMEENHFPHPSKEDMERLVKWRARKYIQDLFRKS